MSYSTQNFSEDLKRMVETELPDAIRSSLERPAGRAPDPDLVAQSQWYNALTEAGQEKVLAVAARAADLAEFSVLVVLDGGDVISEELKPYELRLTAVKDGRETLLASSTEYQGLHDHY